MGTFEIKSFAGLWLVQGLISLLLYVNIIIDILFGKLPRLHAVVNAYLLNVN